MVKSLDVYLYDDLKKGNTKRAVHIVKLMGDNVNKIYRGKSLLVWAKEFENKEVISELEKRGGKEFSISNEEAERLGDELLDAVLNNDANEVERLIRAGANIDKQDEEKCSALILASTRGYKECVEKLIEGGADIDIKNIERRK